MFVTYVLYSVTFNKIYIGYTSSLIERFRSHNFLSQKGYTFKYRPWIVAYVEFFDLKAELKLSFLNKSFRKKILNDYIKYIEIIIGSLFFQG